MRPNKVRELWKAGKPVSTAWCSTPDPYVAEIMARAGFDCLVLDMQHGMAIGPDRAAIWLQIVGQSDSVPFARVPWNEPAFAQQVLDAGCMGLIYPMISTVADARKAIGSCRYPPIGYRSNGPNRASFLGADYFSQANKEIICLLMMETAEGIENIEAIAQLPGVDGFYIGPTDLAISMGLPPLMDHKDPRHIAAVQKVVDVSKKYGLTSGIHPTGPEEAVRRFKQGFNLMPVASDIGSVKAGVSKAIADFNDGLAGATAAAAKPAGPKSGYL